MSREIVRDHGVMMLLGTMRAEERLAAFLLNLSQRFTARGYSPAEFYLRYDARRDRQPLGLKLETVSRAGLAPSRKKADRRPAEARVDSDLTARPQAPDDAPARRVNPRPAIEGRPCRDRGAPGEEAGSDVGG